jgi:hypothetical protein
MARYTRVDIDVEQPWTGMERPSYRSITVGVRKDCRPSLAEESYGSGSIE